MTLLLGPDPEGADHGRDPGARARVPHRPRVDDLAEVLGRDLEWLPVGEEEAHPRQDGFVVAESRLGRSVLVPEPAQVTPDELTRRRRAFERRGRSRPEHARTDAEDECQLELFGEDSAAREAPPLPDTEPRSHGRPAVRGGGPATPGSQRAPE